MAVRMAADAAHTRPSRHAGQTQIVVDQPKVLAAQQWEEVFWFGTPIRPKFQRLRRDEPQAASNSCGHDSK